MKRKTLCKGDMLLIGAVLAAAVCCFIFFSLGGGPACTAVVEQNGAELRRVSLEALEEPLRLEIGGEYPLVLMMDQEGVWIAEAACPDQICVRTGKITRPGQTVVCLPARLSVRLTGGGERVDATTG